MSKGTVRVLAIVMACALMLSGCNLIRIDEEKDNAKIVAEFTGGTITKGEAMKTYASYEEMYEQYGYKLTDKDTIRSVQENMLNQMVEEAIVKAKAEEMGLTELTEEDKAELEAHVDEEYGEVFDHYKSFQTGETDEEINQATTEYLAQKGYTKESLMEYETQAHWLQKLRDEVTKDVTVTPEALAAAYEEQASADETTYANDPYSFESAMTNGETVAYMPEGYRTVKHILLQYTDEQAEKLQDLQYQLEDVESALLDLDAAEEELPEDEFLTDDDEEELSEDELPEDEIAEDTEEEPEADSAGTEEAEDSEEGDAEDGEPDQEAEGTEEELVAVEEPEGAEDEPELELEEDDFDEEPDPRTREELEAEKENLEAQIAELKAQYLQDLQPTIDEIYAKIDAGEDFEALIDEYGADPGMMQGTATRETGYYVSANSVMWDPAVGISGVHIIRYESDVTPGRVDQKLIEDALSENALETAKDEAYDAAVAEWVSGANVKLYLDRMG